MTKHASHSAHGPQLPGSGRKKHTDRSQMKEEIECAIARTGSVAGALKQTGYPLRTIQRVWEGMNAAIAS